MKCNPSKAQLIRRLRVQAFTLIELLLVLTILGILAAIVVPKMVGRSKDAAIKATQTQISSFKTALNTYEVDNRGFPKSLADLVQRPRDASNWNGPYLDEIPKDSFGNEFVYVCPGRNNPHSYDISSAGPDGQLATDDDITNWTKR